MAALPPTEMRAMREAAQAAAEPVGATRARWAALHDEAADLARMARLAPEAPFCAQAFAEQLAVAEDWRRALIWQGLEDMAAIMAPGLAALRVLAARGQDATAPALTLWCEFHAAREAVFSVLAITDPAPVPLPVD